MARADEREVASISRQDTRNLQALGGCHDGCIHKTDLRGSITAEEFQDTRQVLHDERLQRHLPVQQRFDKLLLGYRSMVSRQQRRLYRALLPSALPEAPTGLLKGRHVDGVAV